MLKTAQQVATEHGFSVSQIRRLIRQGVIKAHKVGSYYAIDDKHIINLSKRRKPQTEK